MYGKSAAIYDAIYAGIGKDYQEESEHVAALIKQHARIPVTDVLDVACGTGGHLVYLKDTFAVEGIDVNEAMLAAAREKLPGIPIYQGDMQSFDLKRSYGAVICLFSAIGYADGVDGLEATLSNCAKHTRSGGVVLIEPWLLPEVYHSGTLHAVHIDQPDLKITRMNISGLEGRKSVMDMHHLVGTPDGIEHFIEHHELTLFTHDEYLSAFRKAGLEPLYDATGLAGRGLYIGIAP